MKPWQQRWIKRCPAAISSPRRRHLSDERDEFLINDSMWIMRFLALSLADRVPDTRTIWLFREKLIKAGASTVFSSALKRRCELRATS
ncbi:MAG: transposase [Alphaproteobacteria bacterium]|nr:transposase [Alphaproteobacteria bacterium]